MTKTSFHCLLSHIMLLKLIVVSHQQNFLMTFYIFYASCLFVDNIFVSQKLLVFESTGQDIEGLIPSMKDQLLILRTFLQDSECINNSQ